MLTNTQNPAVPNVTGLELIHRRAIGRTLISLWSTWAMILIPLTLLFALEKGQTSPIFLWAFRGAVFLVVSNRQYGLMILIHEAFHGLLCQSKSVNDRIARWWLAYPLGSPYYISREKHLLHHRLLGAESDPDFTYYSRRGKETRAGFLGHLGSLLIQQVKYSLLPKRIEKGETPKRPAAGKAYLSIALVQLVIFSFFYWHGKPFYYVLYWLLPLFTLTLFWDKARAFCEHSGSSSAQPVLRSFKTNPIEEVFFAPFDMNLHAEHHCFPAVPHYQLKNITPQMMDERLKILRLGIIREEWHSYLGFIADYYRGLAR